MQYVRLVKPGWFNHIENEFGDLAFAKSQDGSGMSVFELESITNSITDHVKEYYPHFVINQQITFCILQEAELPPNAIAEKTDDPDPFHKCIDASDGEGNRISKKAFKRHFREKRAQIGDFSVCESDGSTRSLAADDIAEWARLKALADEDS